MNIFIDDFQLSNPLLSKKALNQEFTGIYFRIITSSRLNFSKRDNIHLLAICKSSFFKSFTKDIIVYITNEIKDINSRKINIITAEKHYHLSLNVPFLSLDSKAASYLLGFKNSFNHPFCCRFCLTKRSDFNLIHHDSNVQMRNTDSYISNYQRVQLISQGEDS